MNQKTNYFYRLLDRVFPNQAKPIETEPSVTFPKQPKSDNPSPKSLSDWENSQFDVAISNQTNLNVATDFNLYLIIFKWSFWIGLTGLSFIDWQQDGNFNRLFQLSSVALLAWSIGIIEPNLVIRFGLPKKRQTITFIYLTIAILYQVFSSII
jgi:hypothetical protein